MVGSPVIRVAISSGLGFTPKARLLSSLGLSGLLDHFKGDVWCTTSVVRHYKLILFVGPSMLL